MRDGGGNARGEPPEMVMAGNLKRRLALVGDVAVVRDERTGAVVTSNQAAGFSLGVLRLWGNISQEQFEAGESWARLMHRHASLQGFEVKRNPGSPQFVSVGGISTAPEPDAKEVERVRNLVAECREEMVTLARTYSVARYKPGHSILEVVYGVCLENRPPHALGERDMGNLRVGLNALAKVLR